QNGTRGTTRRLGYFGRGIRRSPTFLRHSVLCLRWSGSDGRSEPFLPLEAGRGTAHHPTLSANRSSNRSAPCPRSDPRVSQRAFPLIVLIPTPQSFKFCFPSFPR